MKSITYTGESLKGKMLCSLFGHKFRPVQSFSEDLHEFECTVCHVHATNDTPSHAQSLRKEFRQIHNDLLRRHHQRVGV